jgi:acetamidase/formamidase
LEQIDDLGSEFGLVVTADEVAAFQQAFKGPLASYGRLEELVPPALASVAPRSPGYRPPPSENPYGAWTTCIIPEFGGLVGTAATAMLNPPLPERVRKVHVDRNGVRWNDRITLPYQPFIGTIGISPEIEAISSLQPDYHGGNMDLPDVAPGAIVYFPVHVKGGQLYVGDCHAAQGDGELSGVAIEQRATVTFQIDVIKGWTFAWPRLETENFLMTIGSARPLEDAARIAHRELVRWMSADYGFDEIDPYMLLSQAGRIRLGNMVDPKYTIGASILKKYLV